MRLTEEQKNKLQTYYEAQCLGYMNAAYSDSRNDLSSFKVKEMNHTLELLGYVDRWNADYNEMFRVGTRIDQQRKAAKEIGEALTKHLLSGGSYETFKPGQ